jgi:hypothetical protein
VDKVVLGKKKTCSKNCRLPLKQNHFCLKAMGEEKPDEELMGSKSSPRLATTSFVDVVICSMTSFFLPYTYNRRFDCLNKEILMIG